MADELGILEQLLREKEEAQKGLSVSATDYANKMNEPAGIDREQLIAGALAAAIPALAGYAHKGSRGLAMGAAAGGGAAGSLFDQAKKEALLQKEAAKVGYKDTQSQIKANQDDVEKLQLKKFDVEKADKNRKEDQAYRDEQNKAKAEENKLKGDQNKGEEDRRREDKAQKIMELQVPGASLIPGKRPMPKQTTEFSNVVETTSVLENSINQLKTALKSDDLETARLAYSDITFQLKKKYNLGANFTESEQFLNSLQLPTFAKDYTLGEFNSLVRGKLRAENVDTVMDNLLNKTRGDAKIAGITRGYYLHNYQYTPEEASKYKIKLGKNGLAEQDDTGVQNLLSGFADADTSNRLLGNKLQQPLDVNEFNSFLKQWQSSKKQVQ